jgi:hypothetical protein
MQHLSPENILAYLDGNAADTEKSEMEAHLAVCGECTESKAEYQDLVGMLQEEVSLQPPAHFVEAWKNVARTVPAPRKPTLRQIIASLVFDSFDQPILAGVRHVGATPRQRLFRAGDIDVDVKIESTEIGKEITLVGQVLSPTSKFFVNAPVTLESHGGQRYQTCTNEVGEFSFEVPNDTYDLSIELNEGRVSILTVHDRSASL